MARKEPKKERTPRVEWAELLRRTCMGPMGRAVALDFNAWLLVEDQRRDTQALLDSALDRLVARLP